MELLGERNWWLPKRLARMLPELPVEHGQHEQVVAPMAVRSLEEVR